jgi:hypothetical protein
VVLGSCNYINPVLWVVWGLFLVNHFILRIPHFTLANSCALG